MAPKGSSLKEEIATAKKREAEVLSVFSKYDVDGSKTIDMDELTELLDDLGLLAGLKTSTVEFAASMFSQYDVNGDGVLGFEEFKGVYNAAKDDAAGKPSTKAYKAPDELDESTQAARERVARESALKKAEEAEKRRKENAEMKAKLSATKGGDAKALDDEMKAKRAAFFAEKKRKKEEAAAKLKAENAAMKAKIKNTKAATDNDITDDVGADGTVGAGRGEAAAASKARKAAEAEQLAKENAEKRDRIKNTKAATDNDITDDVAADGTVGAGRDEAAAASKARKAAEAAKLSKENAEKRDRIKNTKAASDNKLH